jgi:hypothetical protein
MVDFIQSMVDFIPPKFIYLINLFFINKIIFFKSNTVLNLISFNISIPNFSLIKEIFTHKDIVCV